MRRLLYKSAALFIEAGDFPSIRVKTLSEANHHLACLQVLLEQACQDEVISPGFYENLSYALSSLRIDVGDHISFLATKRATRKKS